MQTSIQWVNYFTLNSRKLRIDWSPKPQLTAAEKSTILQSLQAWQLGETSDGAHLLAAAKKYAAAIGDDDYCHAVQLFIREEQKHGRNLGTYLDMIGEPRVKSDWGDSLFRKIRYYNTSMELWTLAVITVESTAQLFYQSLKDATGCPLLKQICTDILIDEAAHINFQRQRMEIIFCQKTLAGRLVCYQLYYLFYFATIMVVWMAHRKVFKAGGDSFLQYLNKMNLKYRKTIGRLWFASATHDQAQQMARG